MTTPNTPANGGQILTDERIKGILFRGGVRYSTLQSCDEQAAIAFARAIEADLRASLNKTARELKASRALCDERFSDILDLRASLAAPAIPTVDRNGVAEEGAEILGNLIESIEKHGNYSQEATITFLSQAKQCFDEIKSAAAPAPVSGMPDLARPTNTEVYAEMHRREPNWNAYQASRGQAVELALRVVRDLAAIPSPQAPDSPVADCGPNPVTWSEEDKHRLDVALNKMYGTPLPAAPAPTEQEAIGVFAIEVEKMLCAALGREWSVCGISIESLIAALAARQAPTEAPKGTNLDGFDFCAIQNAVRNLEYIEAGSYPSKDHDLDGSFVVANIGHAKKLARAVLPRLKAAEIALNRARQAPDSRDAERWKFCVDHSHGMSDEFGNFVMVQLPAIEGEFKSTEEKFVATIDAAIAKEKTR